VFFGESSPAVPGKGLEVILSLGNQLIKVLIKLGELLRFDKQLFLKATKFVIQLKEQLPYTMHDLIKFSIQCKAK